MEGRGSHRYVISNCQHALRDGSVCLRKTLIGNNETLALDVVPLFETIDDLAHARVLMQSLYAIRFIANTWPGRRTSKPLCLDFLTEQRMGIPAYQLVDLPSEGKNFGCISEEWYQSPVLWWPGAVHRHAGSSIHDFYASLGDTIENEEADYHWGQTKWF